MWKFGTKKQGLRLANPDKYIVEATRFELATSALLKDKNERVIIL